MIVTILHMRVELVLLVVVGVIMPGIILLLLLPVVAVHVQLLNDNLLDGQDEFVILLVVVVIYLGEELSLVVDL